MLFNASCGTASCFESAEYATSFDVCFSKTTSTSPVINSSLVSKTGMGEALDDADGCALDD
ncbi:MAG: hypothetical protein RSA86_06245, partial [Christensenellaceae bacterium]